MHTEESICKMLNIKYAGNCRYKLANAFVFGYGESDFFVQKDNGYAYEFEVKISRSDFFKDSKKIDKHYILERGTTKDLRPNKFFYVVPKNLVSAKEVPAYAGLMYVEDNFPNLITIKEAPFIHKEKHEFEKVLCNKFYYYWHEARRKVIELEYQLEFYKTSTECP